MLCVGWRRTDGGPGRGSDGPGPAVRKEKGSAMTTLLVTGGAGFIGANFVRFVLRHRPGYRVLNVDSLTYSGNLENLTDV